MAEPMPAAQAEHALMLLRVQLFGAAQRLQGEQLAELKQLVSDVAATLELFDGRASHAADPPATAPRVAKLESGLRDVVGIVRRTGGYLEHADQQALFRAEQLVGQPHPSKRSSR